MVAVPAKAVPTEAVAAKAISTRCRLAKAGMKIGTTAVSATGKPGVVNAGAAKSWTSESRASRSVAGKSATTVHPTDGSAAANVAAESATVTCSDCVTTTNMATTALRKGGCQCQRQDERRNGKKATHT
jgi:type V secretory pathway adhesin AidA